MEQFLIENYLTMTNKQLANELKLRLTTTRTKLYELGLKRMDLEYWTDEQVLLLKQIYPLVGDVEIAEYFNALFEKKKGWTCKHIRKKRVYLNLHRTRDQIKSIQIRNVDLGSGYVSNLKRWDGRVTRVGRVKSIMRNGRIIPRIKTDAGFVDLHRFNWEAVHGAIPPKYVVIRIDNTIEDYSVTNLKCVNWQEMMQTDLERNDVRYASLICRGDMELKKTLIEHPEFLEIFRLRTSIRKELKNAARKKT